MMSFQVRLVFLVAALVGMATAAQATDHRIFFRPGVGSGEGMVADSMNHLDQEMLMESESARRQLGSAGYISYGALARNNVPCDDRGQSYYNCRGHQVVNPYNRGCTKASKCARARR